VPAYLPRLATIGDDGLSRLAAALSGVPSAGTVARSVASLTCLPRPASRCRISSASSCAARSFALASAVSRSARAARSLASWEAWPYVSARSRAAEASCSSVAARSRAAVTCCSSAAVRPRTVATSCSSVDTRSRAVPTSRSSCTEWPSIPLYRSKDGLLLCAHCTAEPKRQPCRDAERGHGHDGGNKACDHGLSMNAAHPRRSLISMLIRLLERICDG